MLTRTDNETRTRNMTELHSVRLVRTKGGGKRGPSNVADTLLRTQMFPRLLVRATFVADTNFVSETQKMFLSFVRNILCPQQMFPRLRSMDTKQMFCVPLVCPPNKHHEQQMCPQQCVLVCHHLKILACALFPL